MGFIHRKSIPIFFILLSFLLSGCFSTLQTAKTSDGFTLTSGLYTYKDEKYDKKTVEKNRYLLILMPRYGKEATEKRVGLDFGLRIISNIIDYDYDYKEENPLLLFVEEFKLQIPRNRHFDLAFGLDFYLYVPWSAYVLISKDLSRTLTVYGSGELSGGLYNLTRQEKETGFYPKATLGSEINVKRNLSLLLEMEKWFNTNMAAKEELRFAFGVKL